MASSTSKIFSYTDESEISRVLMHLNAQRVSSRFCDVVLKVCGENIYAHSNVLAAASPYFSSFLGMGQDCPRAFSQKIPQVIEIHIDGSDGTMTYSEAVRRVVNYMYTSKIDFPEEIFTQVLEISKIMQMASIISFCENTSKPDEKFDMHYLAADSQLTFENEGITTPMNSSFEEVSKTNINADVTDTCVGSEGRRHMKIEHEGKEESEISSEQLFEPKGHKSKTNSKPKGQTGRKNRKRRPSLD
ncbi:hypothetical protein FSP39_020184 [Pinctada imbricata]|uniref:BTB domain-containing protein n=1 Tax=Pinctada imbricata TaxID=66713 RepID=A0AA88XLL8_PINIB|nr:hypothetical protein FSP39_020184 [Pinctada imbricata]